MRNSPTALAVRKLNNKIKRLLDATALQDGDQLTGMQHAIISYVGDHMQECDLFQKDIEDHFCIRRSTATGILQLMEKNGYLTRQSVSYDARLKKIVLTDKAACLHNHIETVLSEIEARMTRGVSPEDLAVFYRVLEQISSNLDPAALNEQRSEHKND